MRKEKRYCKKRFDQSEIKMKIKRTPLNLETWPKIHLWHRQMPGDAPKPLQNESSKKKKKAAKFCSKINSKFKNSQVSVMDLLFVCLSIWENSYPDDGLWGCLWGHSQRIPDWWSLTVFDARADSDILFKDSPYPSHFIFEINVWKRRIRLFPTLILKIKWLGSELLLK